MPIGPSHNHAILTRRQDVARRYLHGEYQATIAEALGVSQQLISHDLKAIHAAWLATLLGDYAAKKAAELAKIDELERVAWAAWERSCQPREITLTEQTEGGDDGPRRKASMRREGQAGDPRFLDAVMKCITRRCTILGLDAPQRVVLDWDTLTPEQLDRLAAGESPLTITTMADA